MKDTPKPIAWGCKTCNKFDWAGKVTDQCFAEPEHISYRGVDIGTCKGTMTPLYAAPGKELD